jgi:hypothetical protein
VPATFSCCRHLFLLRHLSYFEAPLFISALVFHASPRKISVKPGGLCGLAGLIMMLGLWTVPKLGCVLARHPYLVSKGFGPD